MKRFMWLVVLALVPVSAGAGTIEKQIERIDDGDVRMTFESREDACGHGCGSVSFGGHHHRYGRVVIHSGDDDDDWWDDCEKGLVRVSLRIRHGDVTRLRTCVGGEWREDDRFIDLGMIPPQEAADFLLSLVRDGSRVADDAILPAVLARDVVIWPALLDIARDRSVDHDARKSCVFWLGQLASDKATEGLTKLVDDDDMELEVRESAVFSLSQIDDGESFDQLVAIARTNRHPQLRKAALFWLAQSDDPRVLDIFEGILAH